MGVLRDQNGNGIIGIHLKHKRDEKSNRIKTILEVKKYCQISSPAIVQRNPVHIYSFYISFPSQIALKFISGKH